MPPVVAVVDIAYKGRDAVETDSVPDVVMAPSEAAPAVRAPVPALIELLDVLTVVQVRAVPEMTPEDVKEATEAAPDVRLFAPAFRAPEDVKEVTEVAPREAAPAVRGPVPALIELLDVLMVVQVRAAPDRPSVEVKDATEVAPREAAPAFSALVPAFIELLDVSMVVMNDPTRKLPLVI
jgi:hypothetical protein